MRLPNDISYHDTDVWIGRGFFFARLDDEREEVCKLSRIEGDDDEDVDYLRVYSIESGTEHRVHKDAIRLHWPEFGYVNLGGTLWYMERIPGDHYTRTYQPRYVRGWVVRGDRAEEQRGIGEDYGLVQALFRATRHPYVPGGPPEQAVMHGLAVSRNYVWVSGQMVGKVSNGKLLRNSRAKAGIWAANMLGLEHEYVRDSP